MTGGVYLWKATAECSACGKVVNVGPFDGIEEAVKSGLAGWITPSSFNPSWVISDAFGTRFTICDDCTCRPLRDVLPDIEKRMPPK